MKKATKEEMFIKGWCSIPHHLIYFAKHKIVSKQEYILLTLLLHLNNWFNGKQRRWFYYTDRELCSTKLISPKALIRTRRSLREKGFIDFKGGSSRKATEYKVEDTEGFLPNP